MRGVGRCFGTNVARDIAPTQSAVLLGRGLMRPAGVDASLVSGLCIAEVEGLQRVQIGDQIGVLVRIGDRLRGRLRIHVGSSLFGWR